jgi:cytosine deaminase
LSGRNKGEIFVAKRNNNHVQEIPAWDLRQAIIQQILANGGWVNAHTHLDRAYTISFKDLHLANATLQEKWDIVDAIKKASSTEQIYDRMAFALEEQLKQGVTSLASFIDVDEVVKDKALQAALRLRDRYKDVRLVFINQTLKGVIKPAAHKWFQEGAQFADIIGGLPGKDKWFEEEHLDILLSTAKYMNKLVHVHVDQFNTNLENETEMLADKTVEHGMQGRVVAIHSISLASKSLEARRRIYRKLRQARIQIIVCPTAWIDSRRSEEISVTHNSIAPVEELMAAGIEVAIGTDNIADVYKPFTDGSMWTELRFLLESCHFYNVEELVKIATVNGRKILGIS